MRIFIGGGHIYMEEAFGRRGHRTINHQHEFRVERVQRMLRHTGKSVKEAEAYG